MCGICGILNLDGRPASADLARKMANTMAHRGPDGEGAYTDGPLGFGHRRLAIIDLSPAGNQPMTTEDGRFTLIYNGEIYNFRELQEELLRKGRSFNSKTDSEVVLHAYAQWGEKAINRFNGMFAFAIWDAKRQELFLARDRYGIKPLYYYQDKNHFLFASEIKALLVHPSIRVSVDLPSLLEYFTFQNTFTDGTLFHGIRMFPPGHYAVLKTENRKLEKHRYWDFDFNAEDSNGDPRPYEEELDRLFTQAVKRQLMSDVPVGAYLSGGMDSGAITAIAARHIPYLASFTCGFDVSSVSKAELSYDERPRAEALSYQFKTELYEVVLKAGDMERALPNLIWHLEDLRIGQCYPNYYISRLAGKFVKVVLGGTGGDELFAGYPWRYFRPEHTRDFNDYMDQYYLYWQRLVRNKVIHELFQPDVWNEQKDLKTLDVFRNVIGKTHWKTGSATEAVNHSLLFEAKTFLHALLVVEDKLSMAWGLESRVPFLDNDLVDFAMRVPLSLKLKKLGEHFRIDENEPASKRKLYYEKTKDGKLILRNVLGRYVPKEYVTAEKQGFAAPDASWFRKETRDYITELILNPNAKIYQYLRPDTVANLVEEHFRGETNRRLLIWSLLSFEVWLSTFMTHFTRATEDH